MHCLTVYTGKEVKPTDAGSTEAHKEAAVPTGDNSAAGESSVTGVDKPPPSPISDRSKITPSGTVV